MKIEIIVPIVIMVLGVVFIWGLMDAPCSAFEYVGQKDLPARCIQYFYGVKDDN